MLIAHDPYDNLTHIDETISNCDYFCLYCGEKLIARKGNIRQHHFSHYPNIQCTDSWNTRKMYDTSEWHKEWQCLFPKENQEIKLTLNNISHRADIITGRTVVEFQHSVLSEDQFNERNQFYFNFGYKVVWLFDLTEYAESGALLYEPTTESSLKFQWNSSKKAFSQYDVEYGTIDLFFQIRSYDKQSIVRVMSVSQNGFEEFYATPFWDKEEFLNYVGLSDGFCAPPDREDLSKSESFKNFCQKYHIHLNKQQERALQAVDGANLLLAVPGSGKTTVLVARLGYMVIEKHIAPEKILAITYTTNAASEMKQRFCSIFGEYYGNRITFCTINSLCYKIYRNYCKFKNKKERELIVGDKLNHIIKKLYHDIPKDQLNEKYLSQTDVKEYIAAIAYIKNMELSSYEAEKIYSKIAYLGELHKKYRHYFKDNNLMDCDDQLVFAKYILENNSDILSFYQKKYSYICVDEAQDTSKIQHSLIKILVGNNHIFMVGDEDQNIFGFRAAYPKALLNFKSEYHNPFILRMEQNYRSTPQIIDKANQFISKNKGRYNKTIHPTRKDGQAVELITVSSREEQFNTLFQRAKDRGCETAFLYRDNDSAVVLVDLLTRNNISFKLKKPERLFFDHSIIKDIVGYFKLVYSPYDTDAFCDICNHGIIYCKGPQKTHAIKNVKKKRITIYESLEEQMQYVEKKFKSRASDFKEIMDKITDLSSARAIQYLLDSVYQDYLKKSNLDLGKIEILLILAKQEPDKAHFLNRLNKLQVYFKNGSNFNEKNPIILSTIHSSKGLEYDSVYLVDVYDGRFPSSNFNPFYQSKDSADSDQEERRLFYVGMTRAKNTLTIILINDKPSSYINELFLKSSHFPPTALPTPIKATLTAVSSPSSVSNLTIKQILAPKEQDDELARIRRKKEKQEYTARLNEVKPLFTQQDTVIRDHTNQRWIQCEFCREIKPDNQFWTFGGKNHNNLGICYTCKNQNLT